MFILESIFSNQNVMENLERSVLDVESDKDASYLQYCLISIVST